VNGFAAASSSQTILHSITVSKPTENGADSEPADSVGVMHEYEPLTIFALPPSNELDT
jgi:hypothetical protein